MSKDKYACLPQFLSALAVSLCASVVGGWMSFTSVAIPKMMMINNTNITATALQEYQDPITIDLHEGILCKGEDLLKYFARQDPGLPACSLSGTSLAAWLEGSST